MKLRNRVAIVTGAGGGLGRCHAWLLARLCARLVVNDMNGAAAEAVAGQIRAAGGEAIAIAASVTDSDQVAAMVERVTADWGRDRKSVVEGKRGPVRVELGGSRHIQKKNTVRDASLITKDDNKAMNNLDR